MHPSKQKILNIYGHEPTDLDDLANCVIAVVNDACLKAIRRKRVGILPPMRVVGFSWDIAYNDAVSNSHNAPLDGETNFGGYKKLIPRHYPGWQGRVWIRYSCDPPHFGSSDFVNSSLTYTGTGGFGSYNGPWSCISAAYSKFQPMKNNTDFLIYSWDYKIFASDWPLVASQVEGLRLLDKLQSDFDQPYKHFFLWEDPVTKMDDEKFLRTDFSRQERVMKGRYENSYNN